MRPENWQQLDELFHAALGCEPEERAVFLDDACAGDESLRKQVEVLLAAHEEAGSFIEDPAIEVEARGLATDQGSAETALATGEIVSHYRIISLLGSGGMGEVYLAQDTKLGREVALKLLPNHLTHDENRVRRFQQEARAASSLNHPNIVTIHEIGQADNRHFIATEYIDGLTLREYLREPRSQFSAVGKPAGLQFREVLSITMQVADALAAAHAKGIVHRDIKPENIMLVKDRRLMQKESFVKVLDFGIAKLAQLHAAGSGVETTTKVLLNTHEGSVIGTATYMSPEQARGEQVDARTDVWSLGIVFYEMLTNELPFGGFGAQDVIASRLKEELTSIPSETPDRLRSIIEKALRKKKEERYQTAREMFFDLRDLQKRSLEVRVGTDHTLPPDLTDGATEGNIGHVRGQTDHGRVAPTREVAQAQSTSNDRSLFATVRRHRAAAVVVIVAILFTTVAIAVGIFKFTNRNHSQSNQNQTRSLVTSQGMKIARLTSTGRATAAAISPDGKFVVHVVDDGKQQSLWISQVSPSSNVQINPPADVLYLGLTFSPGGEYLYYRLWDKKTPYALYQMPVFGGTARKLITDIDSIVTFSPDGGQFAFLRGYPTNGVMALLVANADGTSERRLTTRKLVLGPFGDPAWSPDGKIIAYPAVNTDGNGDFMTLLEVRVADGSEKALSSRRWWRIGRMSWLRDGSGIVFAANEDVAGPSQIWYLSYPGGEVHRITNDLIDYEDISLTADSSALVTIQYEQASNIWIAPTENTSRANQITSRKFDGLTSISWTPDGKIVYDSAASGHLDLWMIEANGTGEKQLTADAGNNGWPSVSPDGRYVVFVSDRTGTTHVWRIDTDGSNPTQLTNGGGESFPQCSPNGQWVVFNSRSTGTPLLKVPIDGGEPVPIAEKNSDLVAISPDGKWVASLHFENAKTNTAIYPFEGGEPHQIMDINSYYFRWTPDGRSLAYVDDRNPSAIIIQPIDGGPPRQLADFKPDQIFSFAWSRDGKQLALARGPVNSDVILIRNFREQQ
jgi:eukaryotic-like serine/threonine-protein kinase